MQEIVAQSKAVAVGEFFELDAAADVLTSPRYNADIAPTRVEQRTCDLRTNLYSGRRVDVLFRLVRNRSAVDDLDR